MHLYCFVQAKPGVYYYKYFIYYIPKFVRYTTTTLSTCTKTVTLSIIICTQSYYLTLILLEPKAISLCHQYSARPACTFVQSDQALYCYLTTFQVLVLISLKMIMGSSKNGRWIIPFNKFSRFKS